MKKNIYKGNELIRRLVIIADFIILNCLLLGLINIEFLYTRVSRPENKDYILYSKRCSRHRRIQL